jgi:hypothetical protein
MAERIEVISSCVHCDIGRERIRVLVWIGGEIGRKIGLMEDGCVENVSRDVE